MLVSCPECTGEISSLASICPKCGYPVEELGIGKLPDEALEQPSSGADSENSEAVQRRRFEAKFQKVMKELQIIRGQALYIEGWIFQKYRYTQEQLFKSEHFSKMDSYVRKIDDDAKNWFTSENTTQVAENIYRDIRKRVVTDISEVKKVIAERKPTWWENILLSVKNLLLHFGI